MVDSVSISFSLFSMTSSTAGQPTKREKLKFTESYLVCVYVKLAFFCSIVEIVCAVRLCERQRSRKSNFQSLTFQTFSSLSLFCRAFTHICRRQDPRTFTIKCVFEHKCTGIKGKQREKKPFDGAKHMERKA